MVNLNHVKLFLTTALSFTLLSNVDTSQLTNYSTSWNPLNIKAEAKSSGGRSGGGSFSRGSSKSGSSNRSSWGSSNNNSSSSRSNYNRDYHRNYPYSSSPYYHSGGSPVSAATSILIFTIIILSIAGIIVFIIVYKVLKAIKATGDKDQKQIKERDNDIVTISKIQVALSANAKKVQSQLSESSLKIKTKSKTGLFQLLQESVLTLLRNSDNWSYVLASSEAMKINKAEIFFNQLSMEERVKLSEETLTNIEGEVKQKSVMVADEKEADYIVVTLIIGTVHDKPLFKHIRSSTELKEALEKLASLRLDYLMKFELIWSPQTAEDSLNYDELLLEYTNMIPLI